MLRGFLDDITEWGWPQAPARRLVFTSDIRADAATGGVERHLICEVQGGRAALVASATAEPLATITLDTEGFVVLAAGRRTADQVDARIAGDAALAQRVLSQFNMMI